MSIQTQQFDFAKKTDSCTHLYSGKYDPNYIQYRFKYRGRKHLCRFVRGMWFALNERDAQKAKWTALLHRFFKPMHFNVIPVLDIFVSLWTILGCHLLSNKQIWILEKWMQCFSRLWWIYLISFRRWFIFTQTAFGLTLEGPSESVLKRRFLHRHNHLSSSVVTERGVLIGFLFLCSAHAHAPLFLFTLRLC